MSFGGKNRKATGPVCWRTPHHPRARWARRVKRCTWSGVMVFLNGVELTDIKSVSWDAKVVKP